MVAPLLRFLVVLTGGILTLAGSGCRAMPLAEVEDSQAIEVRLLGLRSTRTLVPMQSSRFILQVTNRCEVPIALDRFSVVLIAERENPPARLVSSTWPYDWTRLDEQVTILPGKYVELPITPEHKEFALGAQRPGIYRVRAIVNDRFESPPIEVRVLDPRDRYPRQPTSRRAAPR